MENKPQNYTVQQLIDGDWWIVEENVSLGGYLLFQRMSGHHRNYRVVDCYGRVVWADGKQVHHD